MHILKNHDEEIEVHLFIFNTMKKLYRFFFKTSKCFCWFKNIGVTGSWDKKLVLWNLDDGKMLLTLTGHTEVINCVKMRFGLVVSGSSDATLRIWRVSIEEIPRIYLKRDGKSDTRNKTKCIVSCVDVKIVEGHQSDIYCLDFNSYYIASSGSDSKIMIWDFEGNFIHTLNGHLGVVRHLFIDDYKLLSCGDAKKIIVWDYRVCSFVNLSFLFRFVI